MKKRPATNAEKAQTRPRSWVRTLQRVLYRAAKKNPGRKFGLLHGHAAGLKTIKEAWRRVSAKKGAPGVDRETVDEIKAAGAELFLEELQSELEDGRHKSNVIRRVYIPKGQNGKRPLGIPTVKDKTAQMAVKLIIEPLFEADFHERSHGFRPGRDNKTAARLAHRYSNTHPWVVDVDLKSYFDTIKHDMLTGLLRKRISDNRILRLIKQRLKAGILENGVLVIPEKGTPQGGVPSPLLSNIYLHEIDKLWHDNPSVKLVRFADDMVFMCKSKTQAEWVLRTLRKQLETLRLTLNEEKTKIRHERETFDFVGFTFREAYSKRQGRMVRVKYPRAKSMRKIRDNIKNAVKEAELGEPLSEVIETVNRKIRGWVNYFRTGNSYKASLEVSHFVCEQLRIFLRRRKARKDTRCNRKWPDGFFYERGLQYAPALLRRCSNAA